jgi:hypothetical protein
VALAETLVPDGSGDTIKVSYPDIKPGTEGLTDVSAGDRVLCFDDYSGGEGRDIPYVGTVVTLDKPENFRGEMVCQIRRDDGTPGGGSLDPEDPSTNLWIISGKAERIASKLSAAGPGLLEPNTEDSRMTDIARLDRLSGSLQALKAEVDTVRTKAKADQLVDRWPSAFYGRISGYRYAMGAAGKMPSHRFEVIGDGMALYCEMNPLGFAKLMEGMKGGKIKPSSVNGLFVEVLRYTNGNAGMIANRVIPNDMVFGLADRYGRTLFKGATALYKGSPVTIERLRPGGYEQFYVTGDDIDGELAVPYTDLIRI